jgi:predicted metal-dependent HD superfamily phosphohydrolase
MDFQSILNKWGIKSDINTILGMWNESHRSYHGLGHLNSLIDQISADRTKYDEMQYEKLILTALFHDIVYDPANKTNEEDSARFLEKCATDMGEGLSEVKQMILDTKGHIATTPLSEAFCTYDMSIVESGMDELIDWENGISEEYSSFPKDLYKENRIAFLEKMMDRYPNNSGNLLDLIEYVKKS